MKCICASQHRTASGKGQRPVLGITLTFTNTSITRAPTSGVIAHTVKVLSPIIMAKIYFQSCTSIPGRTGTEGKSPVTALRQISVFMSVGKIFGKDPRF